MGKLVNYGSYMKCSDGTADKAYSLLLEQAAQMVFWLMQADVGLLSIRKAEFIRKGAGTKNQTIGYKMVCEIGGREACTQQ